MKILKRIKLLIFLLGLLILGIVGFPRNSEATSLYVRTEKIPVEITTLASQHWEEYLTNMIYPENGSVSDYYLGKPFTISYPESIKYNFPIISNQEKRIAYMLQLDSSDGLNADSFILSKMLATKLEELSNTHATDQSLPIALFGVSQNIFYDYQGQKKPLLYVDSLASSPTNTGSIDSVVYDITEASAKPNLRVKRASVEFESNVLPWTVYETQGEKPWCEYYALAAVINNQANAQITSAKKIIDQSFPNATEEEKSSIDWVINTSIGPAINYVKKAFNKNIRFETNTITFDKIKNEIDNNRPIITDLKSDTANGHAIVLMGYTAAKPGAMGPYNPFYHYWNPWWEDTFIVSSKSPYMTLGPYQYEWYRTWYNFQQGNYVDENENPMTITEINKTMMVNTNTETINTLPAGRLGSERINTSGKFAGWVVTATQEAAPYVYCDELRGWVDKKALTEVIATNVQAKIEKSGYSIDYIPWQAGIQHIGYTKDHINQSVIINARSGSYYFVPNLGWIDKKAFNVNVQRQVDAIKSTNVTTNKKWIMREKRNHLTVLDTNMTIDTLPWGQKGFKNIGRANSYANNYVSITQDAGSYFYSPDLRGWIDKKSLSTN
ncbi:C47 family peptidase [Enterococcus faecalis]|uniref:C47 family peptidase n=2 Tax=Enterococcus faecalis TaxID=1351 RepID=UPI0035EA1340